MVYELIVPKLDSSASLDLFFHELSLIPPNCQELYLNLRDIDCIKPYGALSLALATSAWCQQGKVFILKNADLQILTYLDQIDYFRTFPESIILSPFDRPIETCNRSANANNLLEIIPLPSTSLLNAQAQALLLPRAKRVLLNSFSEKSKSVEKILTMISEITGNIPHSKSEGYFTMQRYYKDRRAKIHIAIGDVGIGIKKSLSHIDLTNLYSDLSFIQYALRLGTTSKQEARGLGLAGVYSSINELSGLFRIRSGTASVLLQKNSSKFFENLPHIPGTQIEIIVQE